MKKRFLSVLLVFVIVMGTIACGNSKEKAENTPVFEPKSNVEKLAFCITDNGLINTGDAVKKRVERYKEVGFTSVRIQPAWQTTASDQWELQEQSSQQLKATAEAGLAIKLIPTTMMSNPTYLSANPDTHMKTQDGIPSNAYCLSYWYEGVDAHVEASLRAQLAEVKRIGCLDAISGIVLDAGAAGEGIYPAAWTQKAQSEAMWCYADNAIADFCLKMEEKYSTIDVANVAWNTKYKSFAELTVPKPGEAKGTLWEDVLTWYIKVKRDFIEREINIYQRVLQEYGCEDIEIIIYMPGTWYTETEFKALAESGRVSAGIMLGADNPSMVQLADKYGCCLQYTGVETILGVDFIRQYMYENGYENIPVFGENAAHNGLSAEVKKIFNNITDTNLLGIDFTNSSFLMDANGNGNATWELVKACIPDFVNYLNNYDYSKVPEEYKANDNSLYKGIDGDALELSLNINKKEDMDIAYIFLDLLKLDYKIQKGDVLEYDVMLKEPMHGVGHIDGEISGGRTIRDSAILDNKGMNCHPEGDLSLYATKTSYHRSVNIGNSGCVGRVIEMLQLAAHPNEKLFTPYDNGTYTVWYDNIRITNNGETVLNIFSDMEDFDVLIGKSKHYLKISASLSVVTFADGLKVEIQ